MGSFKKASCIQYLQSSSHRMASTKFLDNYYRQYDFSKPANSTTYSVRPNGLGAIGRSQSQWDMYDATSSTPSPRSNASTSSLDLARPFTSASAGYQDLSTGEHRYLHRMRWKKEREEWNLANGINFSYTSPYMSDTNSIVKA